MKMIYLWAAFFIGLFLGALIWYACYMGVIGTLNIMQLSATLSDFVKGGWVDFIRSLWNWMLLIAVIMPLLLWIYVNAQRREPEGYVSA